MSGHSKWAQIKRQKGAADAKRSNLFSKLSKSISVAARQGQDQSSNMRLKMAVEMAKSANMPHDNIERAIKRSGAGELEGQAIQEVVYEAFGPGGAGLIIRALTDNRNRTTSDLRSLLAKHGGRLGQANSVLWLFDLKGVVRVERDESLTPQHVEELELAVIDAGADDVQDSADGLTVTAPPEALMKIEDLIRSKGLAVASASIEYVPKTPVAVDPNQKTSLDTLLEELSGLDDVDETFTNAEN